MASFCAFGRSSMAVHPGSRRALRATTMSALSLLMMRLSRRSTSRGAVQRPRHPGLTLSYTSLGSDSGKV